MKYHLRKLTEETTLYEEYYEVEAENLTAALDIVVEDKIDSYTGGYIPETSDFTGWEEIQLVPADKYLNRVWTGAEKILYSSDTGFASDADMFIFEQEYQGKQFCEQCGTYQEEVNDEKICTSCALHNLTHIIDRDKYKENEGE